MQLLGVPNHDSADPRRFTAIRQPAELTAPGPHSADARAPRLARSPEEQGLSCQLAGHTHGVQSSVYRIVRVFGVIRLWAQASLATCWFTPPAAQAHGTFPSGQARPLRLC